MAKRRKGFNGYSILMTEEAYAGLFRFPIIYILQPPKAKAECVTIAASVFTQPDAL